MKSNTIKSSQDKTVEKEFTAEDIIKNTKHWNDGHGLIVHPQMGRLLKSIGINEGYTVYKQIPKGSKVLSEILK